MFVSDTLYMVSGLTPFQLTIMSLISLGNFSRRPPGCRLVLSVEFAVLLLPAPSFKVTIFFIVQCVSRVFVVSCEVVSCKSAAVVVGKDQVLDLGVARTRDVNA
jgi:hypothetical protein